MESSTDMDAFSIEDRKEILRNGIQLTAIEKNVSELKAYVQDAIRELKRDKADHDPSLAETLRDLDDRIRHVENYQLQERTTIKNIMWTGGFIITGIEFILQLVLHTLLK